MGAVDLVIQIESPPSVASALQRVGRAGHQVGEVSRGVLFPKHRGDLAQTAVAVERMRTGAIESLRVPTNPLDVLAQQVVATTALEAWDVDDLFELVKRSAPFAQLPRSAYDATLDLLSGRYPSDEFAELRPRIVWDRVTGTLTGRPGAQRLAVTSGGTIPDRGLFGVFLVGGEGPGRRVGELDEEMVYESRVGDVFALGATSWRIEDITHDRVLVTPAPGIPGRLPFWKGDTLGRPAELGAGDRRVHPRARRAAPRARRGARPRRRPRRVRRRQPGRLPRRAARGHQPAAQRPDARRRAVPRRARRLAARRPLAVRHPGARAVGARDQRPAPGALRRRRPGGGLRRRHRDPDPRHRRRAARRRRDRLRARRDRRARDPGGRRLGAVRLPLPRVRGPRAAAAAPRPRPPLAAVAAAPALGRAARGRRAVPVVPDRPRGRPRVPAGRLRPAGADRADARHRPARGPGRRRGDPPAVAVRPHAAVRLRRRSSCTRATPPSPSAGPPRSPSTRACSPSCSAAPSCASCSTPRCSPRSRPSCSGSPPSAGPATPRASPTCCACSARSSTAEVARPRRSTAPTPAELAGRAVRRAGASSRSGWPATSAGPAIEDVGRLRDGLGVPVPARHPRRLHRARRRPARRPGRPLRPHPRAVHHRRRRQPARARRGRRPPHPAAARRAGPGARGRVPARRAPAPSGATPRCCARCADARWPGSARRSSRSSRSRSAGSCPPGSTSAAGCAGSTACSPSIDQLAGCAVPASALEPLVLAARVRDYEPS